MLIAPALAQEYPVKPLRLIVPYPAAPDCVLRRALQTSRLD